MSTAQQGEAGNRVETPCGMWVDADTIHSYRSTVDAHVDARSVRCSRKNICYAAHMHIMTLALQT
eukprot:scaffold21122_cov107-Isochrysis_galbana.AAC.3